MRRACADYACRSSRNSCTTEIVTIRAPTASMSTRAGMCLTAHPPSGAAKSPPATSARKYWSGEAPSCSDPDSAGSRVPGKAREAGCVEIENPFSTSKIGT